jgi:putative ABC transport system permease protein
MKDYLSLAFNNLKRKQLRSWLTMIGIFIGIASVVALISLGQGLQASIEEQFAALGTDKITITPKGAFSGLPSSKPLVEDDVKLIESIKGVDIATEYIMDSLDVEYKSQERSVIIYGIDPVKYQQLFSATYTVEFGRDFKEGDKDKVVVGYNAANKDFDKNIDVGNKIIISGKIFEVIGVMEKIGSPPDDSAIMMTTDSLRELTGEEKEVSGIFAKVKTGEDVNEVAADIEKELKREKEEKLSEKPKTFEVMTSEQLLNTFGDILGIVQAVLVGIAAISLLVGGIGIMNTMYTAVIERTKEIGTMKAVGAKNSDILLIFLFESGLLGLVGGAIGIGIGIGLGKIAEYFAANALGTDLFHAAFPWYLIAGALAFSFVIGTLSGILPAMQAAKLKPADALRYE